MSKRNVVASSAVLSASALIVLKPTGRGKVDHVIECGWKVLESAVIRYPYCDMNRKKIERKNIQIIFPHMVRNITPDFRIWLLCFFRSTPLEKSSYSRHYYKSYSTYKP